MPYDLGFGKCEPDFLGLPTSCSARSVMTGGDGQVTEFPLDGYMRLSTDAGIQKWLVYHGKSQTKMDDLWSM